MTQYLIATCVLETIVRGSLENDERLRMHASMPLVRARPVEIAVDGERCHVSVHLDARMGEYLPALASSVRRTIAEALGRMTGLTVTGSTSCSAAYSRRAPDPHRAHRSQKRAAPSRLHPLSAGSAGSARLGQPSGASDDEDLGVYARGLVLGVAGELTAIDHALQHHVAGWSLDRLGALERSILRLATYELLWEAGVPEAVAIDEAVRLARRFCSDEAGALVNGILGSIALSESERIRDIRGGQDDRSKVRP